MTYFLSKLVKLKAKEVTSYCEEQRKMSHWLFRGIDLSEMKALKSCLKILSKKKGRY